MNLLQHTRYVINFKEYSPAKYDLTGNTISIIIFTIICIVIFTANNSLILKRLNVKTKKTPKNYILYF